MKKYWKRYWPLVFVLLSAQFGWAQSVALPPQGSEANLERDFSSFTLSDEQEMAFEMRARQLIGEFVEYYNLLRTHHQDPDLYEVLLTEFEQLLYDPDLLLLIIKDELPHRAENIPYSTAPAMELQDISLKEKLAPLGQTAWLYRVDVLIDGQAQQVEAEVIVFRQEKAFGRTVKKIWEVALIGWKLQ